MSLDDNSNATSTPSLRRPPAQQDSHLDPDRHADLQFTAKDHTRHLASPAEWDWQHQKHAFRYLEGMMRYKFLISSRPPQGHSLPLPQLIPSCINAYCGSDRATDIDSRKSTSGRVTFVLQAPLALNSRSQSTIAASSAEAELYAVGLGISDSLHIYQLLQERQCHLQRPSFDFGNLDTQYNFITRTATPNR